MKISTEEYKNRIQKIKSILAQEDIDTLIVSEEEEIFYLTGLTYKSLERIFLLLITKDKVKFILPKMEYPHLKHVSNVDEILYYWEYPAQSPDRWQDLLLKEIPSGSVVGLSSKSPFEIGNFLLEQQYPTKLSHIIEQLRWIKSDKEIELIRHTSKYCDKAVDILNQKAYYGMPEYEVLSIASHIQASLIKEGEFDLSSELLIAAWPSRIAFQPHGVPRIDDVLIEGTHISLSFFRINGYAAELERTFFTSDPTNEQKEVFEIMLEARKKSYEILKAGVIAEDIDYASRNFIKEKGLGDNLLHRTGHGIGLGNHEGPYLAVGDKTVLEENMIVSIEPGIYIEGVGGFRHSDTVLIKKDGYEILTNCVDKLEDLILKRNKE
ncbi:M24 family metallopeptidase [Empedobacter brevis]|uniref:M24 family metallopeptidase n=1 Tax=Empedobacter brevis TaxID=247 RepID=UPI0039AF8F36